MIQLNDLWRRWVSSSWIYIKGCGRWVGHKIRILYKRMMDFISGEYLLYEMNTIDRLYIEAYASAFPQDRDKQEMLQIMQDMPMVSYRTYRLIKSICHVIDKITTKMGVIYKEILYNCKLYLFVFFIIVRGRVEASINRQFICWITKACRQPNNNGAKSFLMKLVLSRINNTYILWQCLYKLLEALYHDISLIEHECGNIKALDAHMMLIANVIKAL